MQDSALQAVYRLQKADLDAGNRLLLRFVREELKLPFVAEQVELRPSAVSLNSISGALQTSVGRKFFKTHIEPESVIGEYYNVKLLRKAGYPVITPVFVSTLYGKQFLIYDWFEAPSLFESIRAVETGACEARDLLGAAQASDDLLLQLYKTSYSMIDAEAHARQPVHQLFLHRLTGMRYREFYGGDIMLPGKRLPFPDLAKKKWVVNGVIYRDTLETIVSKAIHALRFADVPRTPVVTGHGDAHAGNLFYLGADAPLTYFDPAFAGTHSPLLDVMKPLIHDSLLKWLYFPREVSAQIRIDWHLSESTVAVEFDYLPSGLRMALFDSRLNRVVAPMLTYLKARDVLPENWLAVMQAAAMCCPLLTMNLADRNRFTPDIALLGLAMAVELGGRGEDAVHQGWFARRLKAVAPQ